MPSKNRVNVTRFTNGSASAGARVQTAEEQTPESCCRSLVRIAERLTTPPGCFAWRRVLEFRPDILAPCVCFARLLAAEDFDAIRLYGQNDDGRGCGGVVIGAIERP